MNLVRKILADIEATEANSAPLSFDNPHEAYQIALMIEAGLVLGDIAKDGFGQPCEATVIRLTWDGHDFLDSSRDSKIWKLAMEHVIKPGASWSFSILTEWLKQEARQRVFGDTPTIT